MRIQFAVRCDAPSGGALKVRHYFEHVLASEFKDRLSLFMPADTRWSGSNPWLDYRACVSPTIDWAKVGVVVLSGWGWDRFVPKRFHAAAPFRVIYLVQSFGSIDPRDSRFRHLANPAIRICVSKPLEQELRRLGAANGPVHTIPAGLDLAAMPKPACPPETDVLIVGFKSQTLHGFWRST